MSRVLLVDDDSMVRLLGKMMLAKAGFAVTEAKDGSEALKILESDSGFELVLMDLDMPGLGGLGALGEIRGRLGLTMPVVILTGSSSAKDEQDALGAGANLVVKKPLVPDQVLRAIKSLVAG